MPDNVDKDKPQKQDSPQDVGNMQARNDVYKWASHIVRQIHFLSNKLLPTNDLQSNE